MAKIYLIERDSRASDAIYDVYNSFVVVANTPRVARKLCMDNAADEGEKSWVLATAEVLGTPKNPKPRIILGDFNAG